MSRASRRRVEVSLTDAGRDRVEQRPQNQSAELSELVEKIGMEDARTLVRILQVLADDGGTLPF